MQLSFRRQLCQAAPVASSMLLPDVASRTSSTLLDSPLGMDPDRRLAGRERLLASNCVGQLLCEHDRGRVEVAADDVRHDGGVDDPQAFQAVDARGAIDHRRGIALRAHAAATAGVIGAFRLLADEGVDLCVALDARSGRQLGSAVGVEGLLGEDLAGQTDGFAHFLPVVLGPHIVEEDGRRLARVARADVHVASGSWAHGAYMSLKTVAFYRVAAVIVHRDRQEVVLQVRVLDAGAAADEAARLEVAGGAWTLFEEQPSCADPRLVPRLSCRIDADRLCAGMLHVDFQVILEVLAYPRQLVHHFDPSSAQHLRRADPRQLQQLGRVDGAGADDYLPAGAQDVGAAAPRHLDADGPLPLEEHPQGEHAALHRHVRSLHRRIEVGHGCRPAPALVGRHVHATYAFLLVAVHILGDRIAGLASRLDPGLKERIGHLAGRDVLWTLAAAVVVGTQFMVLRPAEIGQAVGITPALKAGLTPTVVVPRVTPHVGHTVDRGRAAEHTPARAVDRAAVQEGFRLALVEPVELVVRQRIAECGGHVGEDRAIFRPGIKDQYPHIRILGQAIRQDAAGRAGANDDVIVLLFGHQ